MEFHGFDMCSAIDILRKERKNIKGEVTEVKEKRIVWVGKERDGGDS